MYTLQRDELQSSLIHLVANYAKLTLSDKVDIKLHRLNLIKTVGLAAAASVQKYLYQKYSAFRQPLSMTSMVIPKLHHDFV